MQLLLLVLLAWLGIDCDSQSSDHSWMTSQISDADPSELSDLLEVDGAPPLLSLTDPSRCLCCCWRCVILLNVRSIFEEFEVVFSAARGHLLRVRFFTFQKNVQHQRDAIRDVFSNNLLVGLLCGQCAKLPVPGWSPTATPGE